MIFRFISLNHFQAKFLYNIEIFFSQYCIKILLENDLRKNKMLHIIRNYMTH